MRRQSRLGRVATTLFLSALVIGACGGGGGGGKTVTATNGKVAIEARDVKFDFTTIKAKPGPLTVTMTEKGVQSHTFVITGVDGPKLEVTSSEKVASGTFELTPGTYEFYCDIPGHKGQGMKGELIVE